MIYLARKRSYIPKTHVVKETSSRIFKLNHKFPKLFSKWKPFNQTVSIYCNLQPIKEINTSKSRFRDRP